MDERDSKRDRIMVEYCVQNSKSCVSLYSNFLYNGHRTRFEFHWLLFLPRVTPIMKVFLANFWIMGLLQLLSQRAGLVACKFPPSFTLAKQACLFGVVTNYVINHHANIK